MTVHICILASCNMESYEIPVKPAEMPIVRGESNMPNWMLSNFAKYPNVVAVLAAATSDSFWGLVLPDASCASGSMFPQRGLC